jgi:hypothetical protein
MSQDISETEISSGFRPKETPVLPKLEEILEFGKLIKEEEELFVPLASRFLTALRRIAFCIISSSMAPDPPQP